MPAIPLRYTFTWGRDSPHEATWARDGAPFDADKRWRGLAHIQGILPREPQSNVQTSTGS